MSTGNGAGAPDLRDQRPRARGRPCSRACWARTPRCTRPPSRTCCRRSRTCYHETVERAPYDPIITQRGCASSSGALPRGEADYPDALRAATDTLYGRALAASGREHFLDKTPAYALVLDFVAKLYPAARYVVLTRHPLAVWTSYVDSFFDGDGEAAHRQNPLLERYAPAIARLMRERPSRSSPCATRSSCANRRRRSSGCRFLDLPFEPKMVDYGEAEGAPRPAARGLGDPVTVAKETRPTTRSVAKRAETLAASPARRAQAEAIVARLLDEDLDDLGHPRAALEAELRALPAGGGGGARRSPATRSSDARSSSRRHVQRDTLGLRRLVRACAPPVTSCYARFRRPPRRPRMPTDAPVPATGAPSPREAAPGAPPRIEVIALDCEITAYAPDNARS